MTRGPNHTRVYFHFFGLDEMDDVYCECCGKIAVDIHHIDSRGMGGSKKADDIKNLMALCRSCHDKYGDKVRWKVHLKEIHLNHMIKYLEGRLRA